MSNSALLDIPRNSEQAYGFRVSYALDVLEEAYREAALYKDRSLSQSTAERLEVALVTLKELFPGIDVPDAYSMTDKLIPALNFVIRTIMLAEDSDVRLQFQSLLKARLYASVPRKRVTDLVTDKALQSIAIVDSYPLAVLISKSKPKDKQTTIVVGGTHTIFGVQSVLPTDLMEMARPFSQLSKSVVTRHRMQERLRVLHSAFASLHHMTSWAAVPNIGALFGGGQSANFTAAYNSKPSLESINDNEDLAQFLSSALTVVDGEYISLTADAVDGSSVMNGIIAAGDGVEVLDISFGTYITVDNDGDEVSGVVRWYTDVAAEVYRTIECNVTIDGVAQSTITVTRNGSSSASSTLTGNADFHYAEYETGHAEVKAFVWRLSGLPAGRHAIQFEPITGLTPDASDLYALIGNTVAPFSSSDRSRISNADRLNAIKDLPMVKLMADFLQVRAEMAKEVTEEEWLKPYHVHIIGSNSTYTGTIPLSAVQVTAIKSRMLTPCTWGNFSNLGGFIEKVYDDVGSLWALAQSTDYE
jgi:hypothetical protein